jgi:hypothetical protein
VPAGGSRGGRQARMCAGGRSLSAALQATALSSILGGADLLAAHLDLNKLTRLLHGDALSDDRVRRGDAQAIAAWDFGPMLAAAHPWRELSIQATLDRLVRRGRRDTAPLSDRALALVANRLTAPGSEHGLARWLETDFVCDRDGRRWVPAWRDDLESASSKTPRVRVKMRQLKQWYPLLAHGKARTANCAFRDGAGIGAS